MLIREFPNLQWLKKQIREDFDDQTAVGGIRLKHKGWPSVVLNTQTNFTERKDIKGPFSLFVNLSGQSTVTIEGKALSINERCYTLSNAGQHYDLLIDAPQKTEIFNIHFGDLFYRKALYALSQHEINLLDSPFHTDSTEQNLDLHTRALGSSLRQRLLKLKSTYDFEPDEAREEEILFDVLQILLCENSREIARINQAPLKSKSAKQEVCKRMMLARDFLHAHNHEHLTLDLLAEISCLSKFHFLRMFKAIFQCTPYQYQKQLRFEQAKQLYGSGHTLEQIAPMIGMENASSVSRLFLKQAGAYPSQLIYE